MLIRIGRFMPPAGLVLLATVLVTVSHPSAQQPQQTQQKEGMLGGNIKYNSGQSIQPIFEGWTKDADGSFQLWFGYLNRNHVQEIAVPVGADNRIEPGEPDRGQPTYFYPRFNRQLFFVKVPSDFAQKQLIWTVVANGQSERAVGWLRPDWEIAPPGTGVGSGRGGGGVKNQPPSLTLSGTPRVALADTLTLTATVTDDGLPPARPGRGRGASNANANRPPAFDNPDFKATTPTNVPMVERPAPPRVEGRLQVSWLVWRGPAGVTFAPPAASADAGKAVFTAAFAKPGDYVLRARVTDGAATTVQDYKVSVSATQP
jgi:hypothetical protein